MVVRHAVLAYLVAIAALGACSIAAPPPLQSDADGGSTSACGPSCGGGSSGSGSNLGSPRTGTSGTGSGSGSAKSADAGHSASPWPTLRIAAGETAPYTDPEGNVWAADHGYTGGIAESATPPASIAGTDAPALFNSQRYGATATGAPASFHYGLQVAAGPHVVTLRFAESFATAAGQRRFDVTINGVPVLTEFDIYATAGGMERAVDERFVVDVGSTGALAIDFNPGSVQNPMVNAIEVAPGSSIVADAGASPVDAALPPVDAGATATDAGAPVQAPLTGNVGQGTWQAGDISVPGVTLPSGKPFHYNYLLPAQYDPSVLYPILVHEHEDEEGDAWYDGGNGDPLYLASASGADAWYNDAAWRTAYPCIVILPYADQTANGTDGDDAVENFGGWTSTGAAGTGTTFSGDSGPNVFAVAGLVQSFLDHYPANPRKVYITGDSLGGIGSWYMMLMYNRVNGPSGKLFTAGLPFAGVLEIHGFGSGPSAADIASLRDVPVFAVSGANDTTSNPQDWNQPLWRALSGNTSYPSPPAGAIATGTAFHYLQDPQLGHDVWDTYRLLPAGQPLYDWLFSQ